MTGPSFLIIDDHPLFLEALQSTLLSSFADSTAETAGTIDAASHLLQKRRFSLVLLDLRMPDTAGFDGLINIRRGWPHVPLAVISALTDAGVIGKIREIGAQGFIHKGLRRQEILDAAAQLLKGGTWFPALPEAVAAKADGKTGKVLEQLRDLTPQQFKVLARVCEAKLNKQIAYELGVTETTIKAHITSIFKKLGLHSRTQAVLLMQRVKAESAGIELDSFAGGKDGGDVG